MLDLDGIVLVPDLDRNGGLVGLFDHCGKTSDAGMMRLIDHHRKTGDAGIKSAAGDVEMRAFDGRELRRMGGQGKDEV